jgi:hypothetical protein
LEGRDATRITAEVMQDEVVVVEKRSAQNAVEKTTFKTG